MVAVEVAVAVVGHPQAGPMAGPMARVGHTPVEVDLIDIRVKVLFLESMIMVFVVSNSILFLEFLFLI